jgi:hypothetical protein
MSVVSSNAIFTIWLRRLVNSQSSTSLPLRSEFLFIKHNFETNLSDLRITFRTGLLETITSWGRATGAFDYWFLVKYEGGVSK